MSESGRLAAEAMEDAREVFQWALMDWEVSHYLLDLKPRWLEQLSRTTGSWKYWDGFIPLFKDFVF